MANDESNSVDDEMGPTEDVELCKSTTAVHKLDVMTSSQFNFLLHINIGLAIYTFGHAIGLTIVCHTSWGGSETRKGLDGNMLTYATCIAPNPYMMVLYLADFVGRMVLIVLAILFVIRVVRASKKHKSEEQAWAVVMLVFTALSYSPMLNIKYLHDDVFLVDRPDLWMYRFKWVREAVRNFRLINLLFSSFGQLFYLWACSHSYGILEGITERPSNFRFYAPKLGLLTFYGIFRILIRMVWLISPSKLPLVTFAGMISNFRGLNNWDTKTIILVSIYTAVEIVICICILRCILHTSSVLSKAPYLKYRAKQLGFRFFLMQNIIAFSLFIIVDSSIMLFVPRDYAIRFRLGPPYATFLFNFRYGPIPRILNYMDLQYRLRSIVHRSL